MRIYSWFQSSNKKNRTSYVFFAILLLGVCLSNSLSSSHTTTYMSPIDEAAHIDYSIQLASGQFPSWGQKLTMETRKMIDCVPSPFPPDPPASCSEAPQAPSKYGANGYSYEVQQPPLGYLPYAMVWKLFSLNVKSPQQQLIDLRMTNWLWILLAIAAFGFLCELFILSPFVMMGAALFLGLNPLCQSSFGYVTNDVSGIFFGLLGIILFELMFRKASLNLLSRKSTIFYVLFGGILGLTKVSLLLIPLCLFVFVLMSRSNENIKKLKKIQFMQLILGLFSVALYQLVLLLTSPISSRVVYDSVLGPFVSSKITLSVMAGSIQNIFAVMNSTGEIWSQLFFILVSGLVVSSVLFGSEELTFSNLYRLILPASFFTSIIFMLGFELLLFISGNYNIGSQSRYLVSLIPVIMVACLPILNKSRSFLAFFNFVGLMTLIFQFSSSH